MLFNQAHRTSKLGWLLVVLVTSFLPCCISAEDPDNGDVVFEFFKNGKEFLRMNKKTGKVERMITNEDGTISWGEMKVREGNGAVASKPKPAPTIQQDESAAPGPKVDIKKKLAPADLEDDQGRKLEDLITDYDRRTAAAAIASYEKSLSVCHSVQIGDRIAGTILMRNKGDKKLKVLELTMYVPVVGREKPEEHRFLFVDKPGSSSLPPQPSAGGAEPEALTQKVDIPCPAGHARGSADLKITYLKFE